MGSRVNYVVVSEGKHTIYALWSVEPLRGMREQWAELWPGWTLEFWGDDSARQCGSLTPQAIARNRLELAERVLDHWPVRSRMIANGVDVDFVCGYNIGGGRSQLDADVTAEEIEHAAALLRGPN
jgi:hypothetical protein